MPVGRFQKNLEKSGSFLIQAHGVKWSETKKAAIERLSRAYQNTHNGELPTKGDFKCNPIIRNIPIPV